MVFWARGNYYFDVQDANDFLAPPHRTSKKFRGKTHNPSGIRSCTRMLPGVMAKQFPAGLQKDTRMNIMIHQVCKS